MRLVLALWTTRHSSGRWTEFRNWVKAAAAAVRPNRKCDSNVQAPFHRLRITKRSPRSRAAYHFSFCALSPPSKDLLNFPKRFPDITSNPPLLSLSHIPVEISLSLSFSSGTENISLSSTHFFTASWRNSPSFATVWAINIGDDACHRSTLFERQYNFG